MKLVLFDIDGTLLSTGLAGADAMRLAFAELYNIPEAFKGIEMSGKTDQGIFHEALTNNALHNSDGSFEAFRERYVPHLQRALQQPERQRRLMPGIPHVIDLLATRADMVLGLLTGNVEIGAQLKLESFGLWHYFRLGAYGSDHHDRNALVPIARQRVHALLGQEVPAAHTYVIGDTPRDIICAKVHGARAVAVATGRYGVEDLHSHQPDFCFADLSDVQAVLQIFED